MNEQTDIGLGHLLAFLKEHQGRFPGDILYARVAGSHAIGTNLPTSDYDFQVVYQAPTERFLGLHLPLETTDGKNPDFQAHELGKFCRLLLKGNPTIVESLYASKMQYTTGPWKELQAERDRFLSGRAIGQYIGYALSQLHKLKTKKYLHTTGGQYNTKWAYHLIRMLWVARIISRGGRPTVEFSGDELKVLMDIRTGLIPEQDVVEAAQDVLAEIQTLESVQPWPAEPDSEWLNEWLIGQRLREGSK